MLNLRALTTIGISYSLLEEWQEGINMCINLSEWFQEWRNRKGKECGFGTCPNCGNSWFMRTYSAVTYMPGRGVIICNECLSTPAKLDVDHITSQLTTFGWEQANINKVHAAVTELKASRAT